MERSGQSITVALHSQSSRNKKSAESVDRNLLGQEPYEGSYRLTANPLRATKGTYRMLFNVDTAKGVTVNKTMTPRTTHWEMCGTICAGSLTLQNPGRRAYLYMGYEAHSQDLIEIVHFQI